MVAMLSGEKTDPDFLLQEQSFIAENVELNGSKFLLGNGYMGYRGTLEEYTAKDQVACILAGVYDRAGQAWREPVNAPNGLYTVLFYDDQPLRIAELKPEEHRQCLDLHQAVHLRETHFTVDRNRIRITAERFLSLADVHLMVMQYRFQCEREGRIEIQTGIDGVVWDINGPHLKTIGLNQREERLSAVAITNEGDTIAVAESVDCNFGTLEVLRSEKAIYRRITVDVEAGREYCFYKYVSIFTSKDGINDPEGAALENNQTAVKTGYDPLFLEHTQLWQARWLKSDVAIDGDPEGQLGLRYSLYQLLLAAPAHSDRLSIAARSLSGQTYKGAIFWDTELFMLPFFTFTNPELARNIIKYRCHTLDGARRKAAEYGYRGAFYAWESQENGDDACTLFNVTDVFSGRPMRTYFRDKQIHISAAVVYGIWQYYLLTGDLSLLKEGGAEVIVECARFFYSYAYFKKDCARARNRYEMIDVTGPDEYHERVSNNAFTNYMVKFVLKTALTVLEDLKNKDQTYYQSLEAKLHFEMEIAALREMDALLYLPSPDPKTGLIEQFDGYYRLEDIELAKLKERVKIPNEYFGGGNGLATQTQIIKQADVVALLNLFRPDFATAIKKANWEFYEPRTEHGSSLSHCIYAILAADIGKPDWAYRYFLRTATIDLTGDYKRYVGDLYIGGTHPAANGGAWMTAVFGFGGLSCDGEVINLKPVLPAQWNALRFPIRVRNQDFRVEILRHQVKVTAAGDNTEGIKFMIDGKPMVCEAGQEVVVNDKN